MNKPKIFTMPFSKVYPLLIAKAERKGRSREEVHTVTSWMTGYTSDVLEEMLLSDITYEEFIVRSPEINPLCEKITGSICGVKIEEIEDLTMKRIRQLDKLIDLLAKGKTIDKILPKETN